MRNLFRSFFFVSLAVGVLIPTAKSQDAIDHNMSSSTLSHSLLCLDDIRSDAWEILNSNVGHNFYIESANDIEQNELQRMFDTPCFLTYSLNGLSNIIPGFSVDILIVKKSGDADKNHGFHINDNLPLLVKNFFLDRCMSGLISFEENGEITESDSFGIERELTDNSQEECLRKSDSLASNFFVEVQIPDPKKESEKVTRAVFR